MSRSVANQSVKPMQRMLDCGHLLTFSLSPPHVGEALICPLCPNDDPPHKVIKGERSPRER